MLTDRGTQFGGVLDRQEYERYLAGQDIDQTGTKTWRPETSGIRERFRKTVLNEFYWGGVSEEA